MYRQLPPSLERRLMYDTERRRRIQEPEPVLGYEFLSRLEPVSTGCVSERLFKKSEVIKSEGFEICSICQSDICFDIIRKLKCNHSFHINCIDKWFLSKNRCPMCRFEI